MIPQISTIVKQEKSHHTGEHFLAELLVFFYSIAVLEKIHTKKGYKSTIVVLPFTIHII